MNKLSKLLKSKTYVFCGEGYLFELERRGYVQIGPYVPIVVIENPQAVKELHIELANCGSDIIEAFTYYGHRDKLKLIGKEDALEELNRNAIRIARSVADKYNLLVAGNITSIWDNNKEIQEKIYQQYDEQVKWAKEEGADYIIAETLSSLEEAKMALSVCQKYNMETVITFSAHSEGNTLEGVPISDACLELEKLGVTVVGINCTRGPNTMLPLLRDICKKVSVPVAALPVMYNTTTEFPTMQNLTTKDNLYMDLEPYLCTRQQIASFAKEAADIGVKYMGICCGGSPYHLRSMVEELQGPTIASKYSADLSKHYAIQGDNKNMTNLFYN